VAVTECVAGNEQIWTIRQAASASFQDVAAKIDSKRHVADVADNHEQVSKEDPSIQERRAMNVMGYL
jgi:hypothetical protein